MQPTSLHCQIVVGGVAIGASTAARVLTRRGFHVFAYTGELRTRHDTFSRGKIPAI